MILVSVINHKHFAQAQITEHCTKFECINTTLTCHVRLKPYEQQQVNQNNWKPCHKVQSDVYCMYSKLCVCQSQCII